MPRPVISRHLFGFLASLFIHIGLILLIFWLVDDVTPQAAKSDDYSEGEVSFDFGELIATKKLINQTSGAASQPPSEQSETLKEAIKPPSAASQPPSEQSKTLKEAIKPPTPSAASQPPSKQSETLKETIKLPSAASQPPSKQSETLKETIKPPSAVSQPPSEQSETLKETIKSSGAVSQPSSEQSESSTEAIKPSSAVSKSLTDNDVGSTEGTKKFSGAADKPNTDGQVHSAPSKGVSSADKPAGSQSISAYRAGLHQAIIRAANKNYPKQARNQRKQGVVRVSFTLTDSGDFTNITLISSSGNASLDKAAIKALKKLKRYKSPPQGFPRTQKVPIQFRLN